ncbi:armadillo-type protein [Mycena vulgaris]|nr:armadillo-type protein [Mycena vulgaris]
MSSLARQRTLESVRSWWSDSNPTGPNINLHALAKPLMKFMYHRQALDYIAEHDGKSLSRDDMEIYASYLEFKYVSSATKIAVLTALITKADFQDNAETVVDCLILYPLDILLETRNAEVQGLTCDLLERLARRSPDRTACWAASVCKQLVSLLRDGSENVRADVFLTLRVIAMNPEGAQAIIGAHVLDDLAEVLKSPNFNVRARTRELLGELASHKAAVPRILWANFCELLVTLLRNENLLVIESATRALYLITKSPEGMQAALDANLLEYVAELLESRRWYTREVMCKMLAAHDGMLATLVGGMHCKQLVSLMGRQGEEYVVEALRWIAKSPEGAQAVVNAGVLNSVNYLLDSPSLHVQREACEMLGVLASHGSTVTAVLSAAPCAHLVSLLRDDWFQDDAIYALAQISEHPEGVAAIAATNILGHFSDLMEDQDRAVQFRACIILRNICRCQRRRQIESQSNLA